jgi:hypothetical protein
MKHRDLTLKTSLKLIREAVCWLTIYGILLLGGSLLLSGTLLQLAAGALTLMVAVARYEHSSQEDADTKKHLPWWAWF